MARINSTAFSPFRRIINILFSALALAVLSVGMALLSPPEPAGAQTATTLSEATRTLNFRMQVDGGIEPVLTIIVDSDSYCVFPEGAAVAQGINTELTFITHEAFDNYSCSYFVRFFYNGFHNCTTSVYKSGENTDLSIVSNSIRGNRALRLSAQGTPNFRTGVGALKATTAAGEDIVGGSDLDSLIVSVDNCTHNLSSSGNSIYVVNAEPDQGMKIIFSTLSGCTPKGGAVLEYDLNTLDREFVSLPTDCTWRVNFADARNSCNAIAALYVSGEDTPTKLQGSSRQNQEFELYGRLTSSSITGDITFENKRLQMIVLLRSTDCVEIIQATIAIQAPADLVDQPVMVRIYAQNTRSESSCSTLNITVTAREPVTVWLKRRERFGSVRCNYIFEPEEVAGGLQLAPGQRRTQSFTILNGRFYGTVDYNTKHVPVQVHLVFPSSIVFTTEDTVSLRLYSPDQCGALISSIGGTLSASVGTFRTFPAYPGTTQVLGREANTVGVSPPYIYTMPPSLAITDRAGRRIEVDCALSVTLSSYPPSCVPESERTQTVTGSENIESFDYYFIFTCDGKTGVLNDPNVGPPTPVTPGTDPVDLAQYNLRLQSGWHMYIYNGRSGVLPQDFLSGLGSGVRSIWTWDVEEQSWLGYYRDRVSTLEQLINGQVLFIYVPAVTVATLRPGSLLSVLGDDASILIEPGLSLIAYRGPTQIIELAFNSVNIASIYRWNNVDQDYEVYLPGSAQNTLREVRKGDLLFVYSKSTQNTRIYY